MKCGTAVVVFVLLYMLLCQGSAGALETFQHAFTGTVNPTPSIATPGLVFLPANAPMVHVVSVAGVPVPANPQRIFSLSSSIVVCDNTSTSLLRWHVAAYTAGASCRDDATMCHLHHLIS